MINPCDLEFEYGEAPCIIEGFKVDRMKINGKVLSANHPLGEEVTIRGTITLRLAPGSTMMPARVSEFCWVLDIKEHSSKRAAQAILIER